MIEYCCFHYSQQSSSQPDCGLPWRVELEKPPLPAPFFLSISIYNDVPQSDG